MVKRAAPRSAASISRNASTWREGTFAVRGRLSGGAAAEGVSEGAPFRERECFSGIAGYLAHIGAERPFPPGGGRAGRGVSHRHRAGGTPHPDPPPQGGREQ